MAVSARQVARRRHVGAAGIQGAQQVVEPVGELSGGEQAQARGRQLQCERQAVEPLRDPTQVDELVRTGGTSTPGGRRPLDQEGHRVRRATVGELAHAHRRYAPHELAGRS